MLRIQVSGTTHSRKGYAIAAIAKHLEELGAVVLVQCGETHNREKLEKDTEAISAKLVGVEVVITEMQTVV